MAEERGENIDAMEEVLAKFSVVNQRFQVAMCGHDYADVHGDRLVAADAFDFAFFEHAQKLCLHGERHVSDFVQEDRAAFGLLEFSEMAGGGASEGSLFVSEEFGLDELSGNGRAVQRNERTARSRASIVKSAGNKFLAGAGFTKNAHTRFAGRDTVDLRHDFLHGIAGPDHFMFSESLAELAIFRFELLEFESIFDCQKKLVRRDWFLEKVESAEPSGAHGHVDVRLARHHDDRSCDALRLQSLRAERDRLYWA